MAAYLHDLSAEVVGLLGSRMLRFSGLSVGSRFVGRGPADRWVELVAELRGPQAECAASALKSLVRP